MRESGEKKHATLTSFVSVSLCETTFFPRDTSVHLAPEGENLLRCTNGDKSVSWRCCPMLRALLIQSDPPKMQLRLFLFLALEDAQRVQPHCVLYDAKRHQSSSLRVRSLHLNAVNSIYPHAARAPLRSL